MKNSNHIIGLRKSIRIFFFTTILFTISSTYNFAFGDNLPTVSATGSHTTNTVDTYFNVVSTPTIDVTNVSKILVYSTFTTQSTQSGTVKRSLTLQLTDGAGNLSNSIIRHLSSNQSGDKGIGSIFYIFDVSALTGNKTYSLQHNVDQNKNTQTVATIVAVALNTDTDPYPALNNDMKAITTGVSTTSSTYEAVTGLTSNSISLPVTAGVLVAASINSQKNTAGLSTDKGEWTLQMQKNGGGYNDIGYSIQRTMVNASDIGIITLSTLLSDLPSGNYNFRVAHKVASGSIAIETLNTTLVAIALGYIRDDGMGRHFAVDKTTTASSITSSTSATAASNLSAITATGTSALLLTQFGTQSAAEATSSFSLSSSGGTITSNSIQRYLEDVSSRGSGGITGVVNGLTPSNSYNFSFNHWTDGPEITSTNILLGSIQLTDKAPPGFWTGSVSTDWNTTGNWADGVIPTLTTNVTIYDTINDPIISGTANSNNIDLAGSLTVSSSGTLNVSETFNINSSDTASGSLIIDGTYSGDITYQRFMQDNQWYMLGSPLVGQTLTSFLTNETNSILLTGSDYSMKHYIEGPTEAWSTLYTSGIGGSIALGQGYATMRSADGTVSLIGTPNFATQTVGLTRGGYGWNLLSNPFTSAIAANFEGNSSDNLLTTNTAVLDDNYEALYIWDQVSASYLIINHATGSPSPGATLVQNHLQVGQGFFVRAADGTADNFSITPAMQSHQTAITFKSNEESSWASIILTSETNSDKASTQILFEKNMSRGLDVGYDAGLLSINSFSLYTRLIEDNGVDFAIQCLPTDYEELIVPIGLEAKAGDLVTFSAEALNIPEEFVVVLEDRESDVFINLSEEGAKYTVQLTTDSDGIGRFFIHTVIQSALGLSDLEAESEFQVFSRPINHQIILHGEADNNTTARVYDITGKLLTTVSLLQATENTIPFNENAGIYIVQIVNKNGIFTQKFPWLK